MRCGQSTVSSGFGPCFPQFPGPLHFDRTAYLGLEDFAERFKNSQDVVAYARLFDSAGAPHYGARYPGSTGFPGTDGLTLRWGNPKDSYLYGDAAIYRQGRYPGLSSERPRITACLTAARLEEGSYCRLAERCSKRGDGPRGPCTNIF
jgi:hypothetical protein